jgi:hypothetical protein
MNPTLLQHPTKAMIQRTLEHAGEYVPIGVVDILAWVCIIGTRALFHAL